jgi:ribonuclease E
MAKTIVLTEQNKLASVYDNEKIITDLVIERGPYKIGDIYIGIVSKILSSINAAFINLDCIENNGFIHIKNLGHLRKNHNNNNIAQHLVCNSIVMVQISKAPTGHKGPTVTGEIVLKGRYLNLLPFEENITFSRDFGNQEDMLYFKTLFSLLKTKSVGIVINKTALNINIKNIIQDFYTLLYEWDSICKKINLRSPPLLISGSKNFLSKVLQKVYTEKVKNIVIDSHKGSKKIASIITKWAKKKKSTLSIKYFNNYNFFIRDYNLDLIIYDLLYSRINLTGGGYIVIEKTEALTTIDVNSGSFNYLNNPRETIILVNRKAAKQIARHIKLRNISGIIIIDFIDMEKQEDQLQLLIYFDSLLKQDQENPRIIQFSELGLVELTRKRQCKSLKEIFSSQLRNSFDSNSSECITKIISNDSFGHTVFFETFHIYYLEI